MDADTLRKRLADLSFWLVVVESTGIWAIAIALWFR
jgi:hypothetical protein